MSILPILQLVSSLLHTLLIIFVLLGVLYLRHKTRPKEHVDMDIVNEYLTHYQNAPADDAIWPLLKGILNAPTYDEKLELWRMLKYYHEGSDWIRVAYGYGRYRFNLYPPTDTLEIELSNFRVVLELNINTKRFTISNEELLSDMITLAEEQFVICIAIGQFWHIIKNKAPRFIDRSTILEKVVHRYRTSSLGMVPTINIQRGFGLPWINVTDLSDPKLVGMEGMLFRIDMHLGGASFQVYTDYSNDIFTVNGERVSFRQFKRSFKHGILQWKTTNAERKRI